MDIGLYRRSGFISLPPPQSPYWPHRHPLVSKLRWTKSTCFRGRLGRSRSLRHPLSGCFELDFHGISLCKKRDSLGQFGTLFFYRLAPAAIALPAAAATLR